MNDRKKCNYCRNMLQLTKEGVFRRHSEPRSMKIDYSKRNRTWTYDDCKGSGREPSAIITWP